MEQNEVVKENNASGEKKDSLERKIAFLEHAKYASIPAALTVGAYFIPNIKRKYDTLSKEKQYTYRAAALTGATILGTAVAIISGYKLTTGKSNL
ncbi:MAG: hypothetical protein ACP5NW_04585 [Candidatus Woesearchaeota archaeon]